jgi:G3E family GTPase
LTKIKVADPWIPQQSHPRLPDVEDEVEALLQPVPLHRPSRSRAMQLPDSSSEDEDKNEDQDKNEDNDGDGNNSEQSDVNPRLDRRQAAFKRAINSTHGDKGKGKVKSKEFVQDSDDDSEVSLFHNIYTAFDSLSQVDPVIEQHAAFNSFAADLARTMDESAQASATPQV